MMLPNGTFEEPIGKDRLFWVRPGASFVDFKIPKKFLLEAGRQLIINGTYKYCYHGSYFPNCSIDLFLKFAEQSILVQKALPMDCREYNFNTSLNTMFLNTMLWQERNYQVYVSYTYVDTEMHLPAVSKKVSEIFISGQTSCDVANALYFNCPSGKCLRTDLLCDSDKNCDDGTDEMKCGLGMGCSKDEFSCADGGCVSWALTCNGEKDCEDGTDEPLFCKKQDSANCSLLNLGCTLSENKDIIAIQTCAANKVKCDFEVGFCGLKHESKSLRWFIASGFTLEKNSLRPPFDHTTFLPTGRYMFIEPSTYYETDVSAVLASDVIDKGEIICIQFWYYMRGQDIDSLKIYIRTEKSKTLIWQLTGEQGNKWAFGQVGHKDDSASYQVLLEGAFNGGGINRVIAVDDLYFSSEKECQTLPTKEAAPNCLFDSTHCSWMPSNDLWKLSELDPPTEPRYGYWSLNRLGGFTYFQNCAPGGTDCHARLSSPLISSEARWKCLQFWYYTSYLGQLKVLLVPEKTTSHTLKTYNYNSYGWRLQRVTLSANFTYQVVFEGRPRRSYSEEFLVGVDNVVFLTDKCRERPSRYSCNRSSSENDTLRYMFSPIYYYYYYHYYYYYYYYYSSYYYYYYYYPNHYGCCNWTISAPYGNFIKLRFIAFQLEEHPSCSGDYIEVYDGYYGEFKLLGRYCGQRYPSFLKSSSNILKILFSDKSRISVLKFYFSSGKLDADRKDCVQLKDCPSSCVCFPDSSKSQDMVVTVEEGKEVIYIPKTFPTNTTIILFQGNKIWYIEKTSFSGLLKLKYLDLSRNNIFRVDDDAFYNTVALETLKLDMNFITTLPNSTFGKLENLQTLDCSLNLIREIPSSALASLFQLTTLSLRSNRISKIGTNAFNYSRNLMYLYLQENKLEVLPDECFNGLSRLKILDISNNRIKQLFSKTFAGLSSLEILKMQNNLLSLKNFPFNAFDGLKNLKELYVDEFILCCYADEAATGTVKCHSPKDEFSSCFDLMKNRGVQVCVWILGLTALLGNLIVILMRVVAKEDNKVQSVLLTNLAISDLLMGIYLLIIAIKDVQWQGEYFLHDFKWRSGVPCALTGVLSMVSSEVSVLMLTVLTTDRLICVVFPFKVKRMNRSVALVVVGGVWVLGTMLAVIPILGLEYFYDKKRSVGFYGKSAVCLPLQLSAERMAGWEYAVGIFIGLNFVSFVYILLIGLLSVLGKFHDPEKEAYIWIAVFVLPVNSSINPILYTFSTPNIRRRVGQMKNSLFNFIARKLRRSKVENASREATISMFGRNIVAPSVFSTDLRSLASSSYNHRSRHNPGTSSKALHEVQEYGVPQKGLKIINTSSILPEETSNLVGFVVACRENGKENRSTASACLLCYEFPESTPLDEYLKNKKVVLNLDTLFVVAMDLIDAIRCLENRGIVHNNITMSTVLIAEGFRVPPVKAILAGFGSSQFVSRDFPDCKEIGRNKKDILGKNIVQFGCVLSELMTSCNNSRECDEVRICV
ncbi:PREDICTED: uncharacterized protein LOC107348826 [Acropora digitifera]|uniref:uncharacterized protein LOC107348826 n=1 Tax=Acropora digitifera TaxID=70779 RepID=UPI00077A9281|nr:PREDICTED: uncharacterized protein LOC107348826 [Acropora digitifera]